MSTYLRRAGETTPIVNAGDDLALVLVHRADRNGGNLFSVTLIVGYITHPRTMWFEEGPIGKGVRIDAPTLTTDDSFAKIAAVIRAVRARY